jgi:hypothetical protein
VKLVLGVAAVALAVGATTSEKRVPTATCDSKAMVPNEPPPRRDRLVLGRVELPPPTKVLQLGRPDSPGGWRFAKQGVSVVGGRPVVLEVPRAYRRAYRMDFGNATTGSGARKVRLEPCPGAPWTSWAGGYAAKKPGCMPLLVRANGRVARVRVSLSRRCRS